jgi:hypothetical protein
MALTSQLIEQDHKPPKVLHFKDQAEVAQFFRETPNACILSPRPGTEKTSGIVSGTLTDAMVEILTQNGIKHLVIGGSFRGEKEISVLCEGATVDILAKISGIYKQECVLVIERGKAKIVCLNKNMLEVVESYDHCLIMGSHSSEDDKDGSCGSQEFIGATIESYSLIPTGGFAFGGNVAAIEHCDEKALMQNGQVCKVVFY